MGKINHYSKSPLGSCYISHIMSAKSGSFLFILFVHLFLLFQILWFTHTTCRLVRWWFHLVKVWDPRKIYVDQVRIAISPSWLFQTSLDRVGRQLACPQWWSTSGTLPCRLRQAADPAAGHPWPPFGNCNHGNHRWADADADSNTNVCLIWTHFNVRI